MKDLDRRITAAALSIAGSLAAWAAASARPGHELARASGVLALVALVLALAATPVADSLGAVAATAMRAARRWVGIAAAVAAALHAAIALPTYLDPLSLGPIAALPWLRHGALALGILLALLITSFAGPRRALRIRAWSALHRLVYVAALLAALHALAVPYGSVRPGLWALVATLAALVARPLARLVRRRRPEAESDGE